MKKILRKKERLTQSIDKSFLIDLLNINNAIYHDLLTLNLFSSQAGAGKSTFKTPALTESMNINVWVVGTSNQLFVGGSQTEPKLSKI